MTWYSFHSTDAKLNDVSISYLNSDRSIYSANLIETYYQKYLKGYHQEVSDEPDFNPWVEHDFFHEESMKDIYRSFGIINRQFFISPRLHHILSEFRICGCVYFDGIIFRNDHIVNRDYLLYCFYLDMMNKINFPKSKFVLKDIFTFKELEEVQISSFDEYRKIKKENGRKTGKKLGFKEIVIDWNVKYDLFFLFHFDQMNPIISEELYSRLEAEKIRGFEFYEMKAFAINHVV